MPTIEVGKILILLGILTISLGGFLVFVPKIPFLGKLPGDIYIKRENFVFYFPLASCIILSIIITFILTFFSKPR